MIPNVQVFWSYVISEWVPKCKMQMMGNQNPHTLAMILMLPLKATMHTWKQHWKLQNHNSLEDKWVGASINYWKVFCCIIGIRVWEIIGGLSQIGSRNNLLLTPFFMEGKSQTTSTLLPPCPYAPLSCLVCQIIF